MSHQLYFNGFEWKDEVVVGKLYPQLTSCISVGFFAATNMVSSATEIEINHCAPLEMCRHFYGATTPPMQAANCESMGWTNGSANVNINGLSSAVREANREDMRMVMRECLQQPLTDTGKQVAGVVEKAGKQIVTAVRENTTVTKKGLQPLKSINQLSLVELAEQFPPPLYEKEDKHWVLQKTVNKETGMVLTYLKTLRSRSETFTHMGIRYGRDTDGRIWCKRADVKDEPKSRKVFYLKSSLSLVGR